MRLTETVLVLAARDSLAAVLVVSAVAKAADFRGFSRTVSGLLPPLDSQDLYPLLAGLIIALEAAVSGLVLSGLWPRLANVALLSMAAGFTVVSLYGVRFRPSVACRCFGSLSDSRFGTLSVIRSTALLALAAALVGIDAHAPIAYDAPGWINVASLVAFGGLGLISAQAAGAIATIRST